MKKRTHHDVKLKEWRDNSNFSKKQQSGNIKYGKTALSWFSKNV